ncbi:MAG: hypothetical protein JW395_1343 [Nitrospira sp.]|nr:hypothetical protein [Nitrospira sp.]
MFARHAHDNTAVHRHKAPIAVLGEPIVACFFRQSLDRLGRQTDIQYCVHHSRHRSPGAGPDRDQQRPHRITEAHAHRPLNPLERFQRGVPHAWRILFSVLIIFDAGLGGNRKTGWNGDAEIGHFGKSGAFPAKELLHIGSSFGRTVTEIIDVFLCHAALSLALTSVQVNSMDNCRPVASSGLETYPIPTDQIPFRHQPECYDCHDSQHRYEQPVVGLPRSI